MGLLVDGVREIRRIRENRLEVVPGFMRRRGALDPVENVYRLDDGTRMVSLLSVQVLMEESNIAQIFDGENLGEDLSTASEEGEQDMNQSDGGNDPQLVIFRLAGGEYGVPILDVLEIVRRPDKMTKVPNSDDQIDGVMNLRGSPVPVLDLRSCLGIERSTPTERQRILIFAQGSGKVGFVVDGVREVLVVPKASVGEAPPMSVEQRKIMGKLATLDEGKRLVMIVNSNELLSPGERERIRALVA